MNEYDLSDGVTETVAGAWFKTQSESVFHPAS